MQWSSYTDGFFNVSAKNGFLPVKIFTTTPRVYAVLQQLIDQLLKLAQAMGACLQKKVL